MLTRLPQLHLDGSLSPEFTTSQAAARNIDLPSDDPADLHRLLRAGGAPSAAPEARALVLAAMPNFVPSGNNWLHFDFCNQFLQAYASTPAAILS